MPQQKLLDPDEFFKQEAVHSIDDLIAVSAARYQVPVNLVKAIAQQESSFDPQAVSPKGAQGIMQLMPQTAQRFGVSDPFDPAQNIEGGVQYLRFLLDRYPGDLDKTLAAYNAGEGAVDQYGGIPPYPETQNYVPSVKQRLSKLGGEDELDPDVFFMSTGEIVKEGASRAKAAIPEGIRGQVGTILDRMGGVPAAQWGKVGLAATGPTAVKALDKLTSGSHQEVVGSTGGAIIGSGLGGPPGAVLGSTIGAVYGEGMRQLFGDAPASISELAWAGIRGGLMEKGGQLGARALGKLLSPLSPYVTPEADRALRYLEKTFPKRPDIGLTPAEATAGGLISDVTDVLQNITEGGGLSRGIMQRFAENSQKAVSDRVLDVVPALTQGIGPQNLGEAVIKIADRNFDADKLVAAGIREAVIEGTRAAPVTGQVTKQVTGSILDPSGKPATQLVKQQVQQMKGGVMVDTTSMAEFARKNISFVEMQPAREGNVIATKTLDALKKGSLQAQAAAEGNVIAEEALSAISAGQPIRFEDAATLRSQLRAMAESLKGAQDPALRSSGRKATVLDLMLNKQMENALKEQAPDLLPLWQYQNKLFRAAYRTYDSVVMRQLIKQGRIAPEVMVQRIQALPRNQKLTAIQNIHKVLGNDPAWEQLRGYWLGDMFGKSGVIDPAVGTIQGQALETVAFGRGPLGIGGYGEEVLSQVHGPEFVADLKETINVLKQMQAPRSTGVGKAAIEFSQIGAVTGLAGGAPGRLKVLSTFVIGGPPVIAKIFTNPRTRKLLIRGIKPGATATEANAIIMRISALLKGEQVAEEGYMVGDEVTGTKIRIASDGTVGLVPPELK